MTNTLVFGPTERLTFIPVLILNDSLTELNETFRISVDYATSDLTATAGNDYQAVSNTLGFQENETVKSLTVPILRPPPTGRTCCHVPAAVYCEALLLRRPGGRSPQ